jgi:uncharacterized protein (PEP-CTERM system associated)
MRRLSSVALSVVGTFLMLSPSLFAGEFIVSPTLRTEAHGVKVDGVSPELTHGDTVFSTEIEINSRYTTPWFESQLEATQYNSRYTNSPSYDSSTLQYSWLNTANLFNETLRINANLNEHEETFSSLSGSFQDRLFTRGQKYDILQKGLGVTYSLPRHLPVFWRTSYRYDHEITQIKDTENNTFVTQEVITQASDASTRPDFYWQVDAKWLLADKDGRGDQQVVDAIALIRQPLALGFHAVALGTISESKSTGVSSSILASANIDNSIEQGMSGVGLAWVKNHKQAYIQITRQWEHGDRALDDAFYGADLQWATSRNSSILARWGRRFYGETGEFSFNLNRKHHQWRIAYNEGVEVRYLLVREQNLLGLYLCGEHDDPLDLNACKLADEQEIILSPGDQLISRFETNYPIEQRLTLNKTLSFDWQYTGVKWEHSALMMKTRTRAIDGEVEQGNWQTDWNTQHRLNEQSHLEFNWQFRKMDLGYDIPFPRASSGRNASTITHERLYSLGYHYTLNRQAKWSLTLRHVNKSSSDHYHDYDDNRITLQYEHMFGDKHSQRRPMW